MSMCGLFQSVRPVVRYVDRDQAVIEVKVKLRKPPTLSAPADTAFRLVLHLTTEDGFEDEAAHTVKTRSGCATVRFDLVRPDRWWPALMGTQPLYHAELRVEVEGVALDERAFTLGLTSVRHDDFGLLVNGEPCLIRDIIAIVRTDHAGLLPVGPGALMLIRDHYAPDVFLDATDRAGILTMQAIPLHPDATPELELPSHVQRMSAHPSLVGWFVGHQGPAADGLAQRLKQLDPTRPVYRQLPAA